MILILYYYCCYNASHRKCFKVMTMNLNSIHLFSDFRLEAKNREASSHIS